MFLIDNEQLKTEIKQMKSEQQKLKEEQIRG